MNVSDWWWWWDILSRDDQCLRDPHQAPPVFCDLINNNLGCIVRKIQIRTQDQWLQFTPGQMIDQPGTMIIFIHNTSWPTALSVIVQMFGAQSTNKAHYTVDLGLLLVLVIAMDVEQDKIQAWWSKPQSLIDHCYECVFKINDVLESWCLQR